MLQKYRLYYTFRGQEATRIQWEFNLQERVVGSRDSNKI